MNQWHTDVSVILVTFVTRKLVPWN